MNATSSSMRGRVGTKPAHHRLLTTALFLVGVTAGVAAGAACGGIVDESQPSRSSGAPSAPVDALSCTGPARVERVRVGDGAIEQRLFSMVVSDGAFVYWARRNPGHDFVGEIVRAPLGSLGAPVVVASGVEPTGGGLAVDEAHVYWTGRALGPGDPPLSRVRKTGGAPEVVLAALADVRAIEPEAGIGRVSLREVHAVAADGLGLTLIVHATIEEAPPGESGEGWRWFSSERVVRIDKSTGVARFVTEDGAVGTSFGLATDERAAYWVDTQTEEGTKRYTLRSVPLAGGKDVTVASGVTFNPGDGQYQNLLAVDAAAIYWLSEHDQTVVRIDKRDGATKVLARSVGNFRGIAVGGGYVYWAWASRSTSDPRGVARVPTDGGPITVLDDTTRSPAGIVLGPQGLVVVDGQGYSRITTCNP